MSKKIEEVYTQVFDEINAYASEGVADRCIFEQAWFKLYSERLAQEIVKQSASLFQNVYVSVQTEDGHKTVVGSDHILNHFGVKHED